MRFLEKFRFPMIKTDIQLWFVFYLIAHGGLLIIPNAIYWDDWVIFRASQQTILNIFREAGSMFNLAGYMHIAMLEFGPWLYKLFTFILMFLTGLLLNLIIKSYHFISAETRFFIVLLFLVLPFNIARVALIDFPYTLCYFLFFLAWVLMARFRIFALFLFFLSFNINSFLVFYALPMLDMFYKNGNFQSLSSVIKLGIKRLDFILLPFVYFALKIHFFSPTGMYKGYNEGYNFKNLVAVPIYQLLDLFSLNASVWLSIILSICTFLLIRSRIFIVKDEEISLYKVGLLAFLLGAFPYWIVGLIPTFDEWSSRHQLLLPLGSALIIMSGVSIYNGGDVCKRWVLAIVLGVSLALNVTNYTSLFIDWQKQQQLMSLFRKNADIKGADLIIIKDNAKRLNAINRNYRFYEWNGILEKTFGSQKYFAITQGQLNDYLLGKLDPYISERYKAGLFGKVNLSSTVVVEIDLVQPVRFYEKVISNICPKLAISVLKINIDNLKK